MRTDVLARRWSLAIILGMGLVVKTWASQTQIVTMAGSVFDPVAVTVSAGQVVQWTNQDGFVHTATSDPGNPVSGGPDSGSLSSGGTYSWSVPTNAISGTRWFYHCDFHGSAGDGSNIGAGMAGVITVSGNGGISLATHALAFSATYQGTNPAAQMIGLTNIGGAAFTYTNVITYSAGASGWLRVLPSAGTIAASNATTLTNQVNITGLNAGTYYATNQVTADATNSPQTVTVTLTVTAPNQPPVAPTGVSASDGTYTNKVRVTWNASSGATSYEVWRYTSDSSGSASKISSPDPTGTSYDDTSATAGSTYYYWMKATNAYGASAFSVSDSGYSAAPGAPSAPTNVVASDGVYSNKVRVSWDTVSDATSYQVWRNTSNDWASSGKIADAAAFTAANLVPAGVAEVALRAIEVADSAAYDDTTAAAGAVYYYWVKSKNSYGTSGFSTEDSGYVAAAGSLTPPANITASDGTYTNKVRIIWSAVNGVTAYEVWRGIIDLSSSATMLGETAGTLVDDTDVISETVYYYWLKAKNATETSAFSSSDSGYRANVGSIQPDVKINEVDGTITLQRGADLNVAILLMTSSTIDADWWFVVATPGGWYYYNASSGTWQSFTDLATLRPSYQGPLFEFLAPVEIIRINTGWLLPGVYAIYFGVDTTMDGILNETLYYDSATLNLVE